MHVKCVCVGDCAVGKTSMLVSYKSEKFPAKYVPTVFDNCTIDIMGGNTLVTMHLWDSAGNECYDRLRPLSYTNTDVFLVCYSIHSPMSFENVTAKWLPEIRAHCPNTPFLLVGTQCDLRTDKSQQDRLRYTLVDPACAEQVGLCAGASLVIECSAKTEKGLKDVFVEAAKIGLAGMKQNNRSSCVLL